MKILFAASECSPVVKVGGLADVVGSLPKALKENKIEASVVIPFYKVIKINATLWNKMSVLFKGKKQTCEVWKTTLPGSPVPLYLIKNNEFLGSKKIYPEKDASSGGSKKEAEKFLFFSFAAAKLGEEMKANILHCHDWHTAIIPRITKIKTVLTIHNLAYQGSYSRKIAKKILGEDKPLNCLRSGILNADIINTVSPNYAKEILTKEFGCELEKILQKRKNDLFGILNGIDTDFFNPKTDKLIPFNYSSENLNIKKENKRYLQETYFSENEPSVPLFGLISRLAYQKGIEEIIKNANELGNMKINLIVLGTGLKDYEKKLSKISKKFANIKAIIDFNEKLAHQIYASADIFLIPSNFEPCGLSQMISMRYGTIPLVRETGGLKDTVNEKIGFIYKKDFMKTLKRAAQTFKEKDTWREMMREGMKRDFSWEKSAKRYLGIYKKIIKTP